VTCRLLLLIGVFLVVSGNVEGANSETVQILLQQNEKFKEALVTLKEYSDQVQHQRDELSKQIQDLHTSTIPQLEGMTTFSKFERFVRVVTLGFCLQRRKLNWK